MHLPTTALPACALVAAFFLAGCAKPEPPQLTVKQVKVSRIDLGGVEVTVDVETFNPNSIELSARRVTGQVLVDGRYDLGTVTVERPVVLPAHGRANIEAPLAVSWQSVTTLATIAASSRPVPYSVKGTVNVGGDRFNIDLPFTAQGTFTAQELAQAVVRSLPIVR